jgi:two-component system, OmpR family, sensor kinase
VFISALSIGWSLHSRAIRPIEQIRASVGRISQGQLSERVEVVDSGDEFGRLAGTLNATFAELESAFVRQRQFAAEVVHEFRTPLAAIIAETQTMLSRERTAAEYRATVQADLDTAQQMRRLTESLLDLARVDAASVPAARGTDLAQIAQACVERIAPVASEHNISIDGDYEPAPVLGDPDRLNQLIWNILSNAIYYNVSGGSVRVATGCEGDTVILTVADTGIGVGAADLPHIFERFYRVGKGHSNTEGHAGLGLAICKAIVDAHRGTIEVASTPQAGTTFTVRLPR